MKYYKLYLSVDSSDIGTRNGEAQVEMTNNMHLTGEPLHTFFKNASYESLFDSNVSLSFKKNKNAILTDILSYSPFLNNCHFLINNKLYNIFTTCAPSRYVFLNSKIQDAFDSYRMFYCPMDNIEIIDFSRSLFYEDKKKDKLLSFIDLADFKAKENKFFYLKPSVLYFTGKQKSIINCYFSGLFVSESFLENLVLNKISGIDYSSTKKTETEFNFTG